MTTQLFNSQATETIEEPEKFLDELVGEGKKYQDPESLAKGAWHKDRHISRLEQELADARAEIQKRLAVEDAINQLKNTAGRQSEESAGNTRDDQNAFDGEGLKTEVLSEVQKMFQRTQAQRNVERVANELQKAWGSNYQGKLKARAKELGLDENFLADLAETKPDTFLGVVMPRSSVNDSAPPRSSNNAGHVSPNQERNKAYYDRLKKENPKLYWKRETQAAEHRDAIRLGSKFFE